MKKNFLFIFLIAGLTIGITSCDDDDGSEPNIIACEYFMPEAEAVYTYANADTSFTINIGPDTVNTNNGSALYARVNNTNYLYAYNCTSLLSTQGPFEGNDSDQDALGVFWDKAQEDYIVDDVFVAEDYLNDLAEFQFSGQPFPTMVTFYLAAKDTDLADNDTDYKASYIITIPCTLPSGFDCITNVGSIGRFLYQYEIISHSNSRNVNGVNYEDVIEIALTITLGKSYGGNSIVRTETFAYWLARDIGVIETTDKGYKLVN